jgi:hypothetical protein
MAHLIADCAAVAATWLVLMLVFVGLGGGLRRLYGLEDWTAADVFTAFWLGWGSSLALLMSWNFLWPVGWPALLFLGGLGMLGLLANAGSLGRLLRACFVSPARWSLFLLLLSVITSYGALQALAEVKVGDTGLYHLSSVRWAQAFAVVPGLGNLHGRLAFNQSFFLYGALVDSGPWRGNGQHVAGGLLWVVYAAQGGMSLLALFTATRPAWNVHAFRVLLFPGPFLYFLRHPAVSSFSPNLAVTLLGCILAAELAETLFEECSEGERSDFRLFTLALLMCAGVSVKLSFAAFGGACFLTALAARVGRTGLRASLQRRRLWLWVCVSAAVILGLWMARGVVLSGYIAFPSTLGGFPVEWRMPAGEAAEMARVIASWARAPGKPPSEVLGQWAWFVPWLQRVSVPLLVTPLAVFVLASAGALWLRLHRAAAARASVRPWLLLAPAVVGALFWFVTAPDFRFAGPLFWILAAAALTLCLRELGLPRTGPGRLVGAAVVVALALMAIAGHDLMLRSTRGVVREALHRAKTQPGLPPLPRADWTEFVTRSGLILYVPVSGDQCWDAPLPCTPYPSPDLRLRRPGDLSGGFMPESSSTCDTEHVNHL